MISNEWMAKELAATAEQQNVNWNRINEITAAKEEADRVREEKNAKIRRLYEERQAEAKAKRDAVMMATPINPELGEAPPVPRWIPRADRNATEADAARRRVDEAKKAGLVSGQDWRRILIDNLFDLKGKRITSQQSIAYRKLLDIQQNQRTTTERISEQLEEEFLKRKSDYMKETSRFLQILKGTLQAFGFRDRLQTEIIVAITNIFVKEGSAQGFGLDSAKMADRTRTIEFEDE